VNEILLGSDRAFIEMLNNVQYLYVIILVFSVFSSVSCSCFTGFNTVPFKSESFLEVVAYTNTFNPFFCDM
jgi:hypothetical protein